MGDDELDELLEKLERRAERLKVPASQNVRATDAFGRAPSALRKDVPGRPRVGDAVGESYEVEEIIGHTETATVLRVRHRGVDRQFAMKLLPNELASDTERVERFQDEARAASMIGHENIVFVTDFGRSNRFGLFYVMEYLNGESLGDRLCREGSLSMQHALNVALCAGSALAAVHELGIVHRDVQPANLHSHASDGEEAWKLLDFGASSKVVGVEEAMALYGEPLYIAPEQASGGEVDARADQFGLAATLVHLLTGQPPWPKRTWTTATAEHWSEPEFDDSKINPFLGQVLTQALAADAEDRHDDIESFVAAFQRSSGESRRPTVPPIDVQEAARAISGEYASASVTIGTTFESEVSEVSEAEDDSLEDPPSVEISLDMLADARTKITMDFLHATRLRREWRRNLVSGVIFVPTERTLPAGTPIVVAIRYAPSDEERSFPGHILPPEESSGGPRGLAIEIDPELRDDLHEFLYSLNLGLLEPSAVVRPIMDVRQSADLTADQAFLLTRVTEPTEVGRLRATFASLPIDFEEILEQLLEKEYVTIEGAERTRRPSGSHGAASSETSRQRHFVRMTLERADYFRDQGNFLAEIETLELACERVDEPQFHYRAGLSKVQFQNDIDGAIASMRRAVELAPDEPKFARALAELERLKG